MKKPANRHVKKRKITPGTRVIRVIGCVAVVYFILQAANTFFSGVETISATHVVVNESITATGYFVRNETVVDNVTSEAVEHVVYSGEKVQAGTQLAVTYVDENALNNSRASNALDDEISLLQNVLNTTATTEDTAKLDQMLAIKIQDIAEQMAYGDMSNVSDSSTAVRQLILRRGAGVQDADSLRRELADLQSQKQALELKSASLSNSVVSPCDGYFCDTVDGYETVLNAKDIANLNVSAFEQKVASVDENQKNEALGKVVKGFSWYFGAVLPKERAMNIRKGQAVTLRFTQLYGDIPATVYSVKPDEASGKVLLILKGNRICSELVSMRDQVAEIILGTYAGIKIPKSAIHMEDKQVGVYTLNGNISNFKPIKTLYEGDNYYVVEQNGMDSKGIVLQDNIIVHARGLADKKVVIK